MDDQNGGSTTADAGRGDRPDSEGFRSSPLEEPNQRTATDSAYSAPTSSGDHAGAGSLPGPKVQGESMGSAEADRTFAAAVALFNQVRYWHAHEEWERLWRAADGDDRDFYQGLIQIAAGLLHLQRRNARGARNKLSEGVAKLHRFQPRYRGITVDELVVRARNILDELDAGGMPYLVPPPMIKFSG